MLRILGLRSWSSALSYSLLFTVSLFAVVKAGMPRSPQGSTVIGIDFGSQFVKASFVAPGESDPIPIMLNDMSERKTANAIAFRRGQVHLGPHALKPILNQPETGYVWLNSMLGRRFEDPAVQAHMDHTIAGFVRDEASGSVAAKISENEVAPIEYLSAILLSKLIQQAEADSKKLIKDAVITVPPYFGQSQRQAILDAAKIAGLGVLSLTNDISAAALYYGTFSASKATEPRYNILFDSGATHTSAALVYIHPNHSEDGKSATLVEVKRTISDLELNGLAIDRAVAKILASKFATEHNGMTVPLGKSYNRLLTEAGKVKHILSANDEIQAIVEELVGDYHLSTKITRAEVESECASMQNRASLLIENLLLEAGMSIDEIHSIAPIGGNSRVLFVQDDLKKKFGEKVQFGLNMDETVAKGAAWYAASLARFKVKATRFRDSYPFDVSLTYQNTTDSAEPAKPSTISIYPAHSVVDGHKGVAFKNMDSLTCKIFSGNQGDLFEATIEGMNAAVETLKDKNILTSKLKFWVDLSTSGLVELKDQPVALVEYETTQPKASAASPTPTPATTPETPSASGNDTVPAEPQVVEMETVVKTEQLPLKFNAQPLTHQILPSEVEKWATRYHDYQFF